MSRLAGKTMLIRDIALALLAKGVPDLVMRNMLAQFAHETAGFTSNVFIQNNNVGGMKVPVVRKSPYIQTAGTAAPSSEGGTYAKYATPVDSALDVLHLFEFNKVVFANIQTVSQFAAWLKQKSYYGAPLVTYEAGLNYWLPIVNESLQTLENSGVDLEPKKQLSWWVLLLPGGVLIFAILLTIKYFRDETHRRPR